MNISRQVQNLKWTLRNYDIVEVVEVCHGCSNPRCKPFRVQWGNNAPAFKAYQASYLVA